MTDKPEYAVPSMSEVEAIEWNGRNVVSTFSGAGGSCLGYRMAGYRVLWASEFVPAARDVYRLNHPTSIVDERDIRDVQPHEILEAIGLNAGEIDLLDGSPPCSSFSTAGKRDKGWGKTSAYSDTEQRTDDLFFEYARILEGLQPKSFVAENVSGLVKGRAKGYFKEILARLRAAGYRVGAKVLDAQWLGVPQQRQRLIFVGFRSDLKLDPVFPKPLPYRYTVRDALPWLSGYKFDPGGQYSKKESVDGPAATVMVSSGAAKHHHTVRDAIIKGGNYMPFDSKGKQFPLDEPLPTVMTGSTQFLLEGAPTPDELAEVDVSRFAIGPEALRLDRGQTSRKYLSLVRTDPERPSFTVTATAGNLGAAGPIVVEGKPRKFTIRELRRIQSFPDDFQLTGSYTQQWERLGRSVPPLMMQAIASRIASELETLDAR